MKCPDENTIAAYLEGLLSPEESAEIAKHVDHCAICRELLVEQVRLGSPSDGAKSSFGELTPDDLPISFRYAIHGEYARGGQARIMLAMDEIIGREVALKEILPEGSDSPGQASVTPAAATIRSSARFLREARISGQLQHPSIVPVYEIGKRDDGRLYYTMQLVRGQTLALALAGRGGLQERLALLGHFLDLCNAIAYAHSRGVIHRDIKPQNVMVGDFGETVLLDWGLAKVKETLPIAPGTAAGGSSSPVDEYSVETIAGTTMGTPAYMSPEQANGWVTEIDERSDIFCLGAVLYEILTSRPPHSGRTTSAVMEAAKRCQVLPVREQCPQAPAELAAIAEKALEKEKQDRFQSAHRLAEEVSAYMTGERVAAYDYSAWDLIRRFATRHKIMLGAASLVILVIITALVLLSLAYKQEADALHRATIRQAEVQREASVAAEARGNLLEARSKLRASIEILDSAPARALWWRLSRNPLQWQKKLGAMLYDLEFTPDGKQVAVASQDRSVYLIRTDTMAMRILPGNDQILTLDISPDGKLLATGTWSGKIHLYSLERGVVLRELAGHNSKIWKLRFHPDGKQLASSSEDKHVKIWDVASGKMVRLVNSEKWKDPGQATGLGYSPSGKYFASLHGRKGRLALWDAQSGEQLRVMKGHERFASSLSFSADEKLVASGGADNTVRVWDVETGASVRVLKHASFVTEVRFAPEGHLLATSSYDGSIRLWDASNGKLVRRLAGHADSVDGLAFSPDGSFLASSGMDGIVKLWNLSNDDREDPAHGHLGDVRDAGFSPDGKRIASAGVDASVRIWEADTGRQSQVLDGPAGMITGLDFDPDGRHLAAGAWDRSLSVWELATGERRQLGAGRLGPINVVRYSPGGDFLAVGCANTTLHLLDASTGKQKGEIEGHGDQVHSVAFSPDGKQLASGGRDWWVHLWSLAQAKRIGSYRAAAAVMGVAFGPQGRRVASVGEDGALTLWDLATGKGRIVGRRDARAYYVDFHPDGNRIGVAYADEIAGIWDLNGGSFLPLVGHRAEVNSIRFDRTGERVVTAGDDETVRLWETGTGKPLWRAPLMLPTPPTLFSHLGWIRLDQGGQQQGRTPETAWARAVEDTARMVSVAPGEKHICLATYDGRLEQWSLEQDTLLFSWSAEKLEGLQAVPGGCLVLAGEKARLLSGKDRERLLMEEASAIAWSDEEILVASGDKVGVYTPAGDARNVLSALRRVTAMTRCGGQLALGLANGKIAVPAAGEGSGVFYFSSTPPSPVVRMLPGPMDTLIAGHANGHVGIWSFRDGSMLDGLQLHGAAVHLRFDGDILYSASELGDYLAVDLGIFHQDYCDLVRRIWNQVPTVWEDGRPHLRLPPSDHACRSR